MAYTPESFEGGQIEEIDVTLFASIRRKVELIAKSSLPTQEIDPEADIASYVLPVRSLPSGKKLTATFKEGDIRSKDYVWICRGELFDPKHGAKDFIMRSSILAVFGGGFGQHSESVGNDKQLNQEQAEWLDDWLATAAEEMDIDLD